jgi:hypothetical protein
MKRSAEKRLAKKLLAKASEKRVEDERKTSEKLLAGSGRREAGALRAGLRSVIELPIS